MSRFRKITVILAAVFITLALLFSISLVQKKMNSIIIENKLTDTDPIKNAPPIVAFTTVALGSFRGILADLLWLRSITLQDEGNYFEMVQLASWITKLQPRFAGATAYLAWNMAYNISVTCSSFEDRWRWVQRGIELIRDEAIQYNPADPLLYKEIGWIYQHKVGNIMDDANLYYKNQMAISLMKAFGGPEPDWKKLAAAPGNEKDFLEKFPPEDLFWKALKGSGFNTVAKLEEIFRKEGQLPEAFTKILNNSAKAELISDYFRASWLRSVFKLDPSLIYRINQKYGKLDWRLPEAHAIYWAELGLEKCPKNADISLERMISQSLKDAFMSGKLLMVDKNNFQSIITVPNMELADAVKRTYEEAYEKNKSNSFKSALENFMKDAIVIFYNFGNYSKAQEYLGDLRKEYPGHHLYRLPLDNFVLREWSEDVQSSTPKQANDIISGLIFRSCYYLAYGDATAALAHEKLARLVYNRYQKDQSASLKRTGLAPFNQLKDKVTQACLKNFPPALAELLKAQLKIEQTKTPAPADEKNSKAETVQ
ncbi:MAG: hypothetical protein A2017_09070 [Lentisphaerae bacterium GWF2_44_16]|nr:MAG: hypothetical protein A2017_09070 [Lentisphaerae bacterium GWF2_44_16]